MIPSTQRLPPPRVLIVMPDQWRRALLRAALREVGYDAVGARTLGSALRVPVGDADRGPVRLVVLDQSAVGGAGNQQLARLLARHGTPDTILLARSTVGAPAGPWRRILRRPMSVADVVANVQTLLSLPRESRTPLD